jgi:ATP-dependent protease ClpP protease subunit
MALSFSEKRSLQKVIATNLASLQAGNLSFQDKRKFQKEIQDAFARLKEAVELKPEAQNQKLADLIAGKYNNEPPEGFLKVLKEIVEEINDIEPVKPPTIAYIEVNQDKVNSIMESALGEVFGKLWDKTKGFPIPIIGTSSSQQATNDAVRVKPQDGDYGPPKKISIDIDDDFYGPTSFRAVIRAIEEARAGDTIEIKLNSNGGDTQAAQAIYVALLKTLAKTKAIIINAYSAGSIVAMACDEIEPTPFCTMMIHNASTFSGGKLGDLAGKAAFLNDYFGEWFQQLYAGFLTEEELKDIIKGQDFWLKEPQIRERLKNWKPIRQRLQENGTIKAA